MTVVVSKREVGVCRHEFEIEAPADVVDAEYLRVAMGYRRRARLDGFRKGKAPLDLVRQRFADSIGEDVSERLAPKYWELAREEVKVRPMLPPRMAPVEVVPGQPLRFKMTVDVEPEVDIGDDRRFDLPLPETAPTEAEVDQVMEQVRHHHSIWKPVERSAAIGDRIRGKIHRAALPGFEDAPPGDDALDENEGPATHDIDFALGDEQAWPELADHLTGRSAGQTATFECAEILDDIERQRRYDIELHEVLERELPEVDDDWASGLGAGIGSVEDLRENLRRQVEEQKVEAAKRQRTNAAMEQLRERYPVDVPEAAVELEALRMSENYLHDLARQGATPQAAPPWEQLAEAFRPQAAKRVHVFLLLDCIARADGIETVREDVERALSVMARARNVSRAKLRRDLEREGGMARLKVELRREKTVQALLAANAPTQTDGETADSETADSETAEAAAGGK